MCLTNNPHIALADDSPFPVNTPPAQFLNDFAAAVFTAARNAVLFAKTHDGRLPVRAQADLRQTRANID